MHDQDGARGRVFAAVPVEDRRQQLAGIPTAFLEGGDGPPIVLLHGPAGNSAQWMRVIPDLVPMNRVVVPDLPGQGASGAGEAPPDADRVLAWLGELIEATCPSPPALVGYALGGAIAARYAAGDGARLSSLVLVDMLGLTEFAPPPEFGRALHEFMSEPSEETHDGVWRYCALDLDRLRGELGGRWDAFRAYNVERARTPAAMAALGVLMEQFGMSAIPRSELERIAVPTTLIWGRHDTATRLEIAEAASARYGWPLHVIEDVADDPPIEQPEAFMQALRSAIAAEVIA